jgi:hypothetical protein
MTAVLAVGIFVITYTLIATELIPRVQATIGGVVAMAVAGLVDTETAFYNPDRGIDWNVVSGAVPADGRAGRRIRGHRQAAPRPVPARAHRRHRRVRPALDSARGTVSGRPTRCGSDGPGVLSND